MRQTHPKSATRRFKLGVFIMRGQPVTNAHIHNIEEGLRVADELLVIFGSANAARRHDFLPFTVAERTQMLKLALSPEQNRRVHITGVEDQGHMAQWAGLVRKAANAIEPDNKAITLVGHGKDAGTSFYLRAFPGWHSTATHNFADNLSATHVRQMLFNPHFKMADLWDFDGIPNDVRHWLREFVNTETYDNLVAEAVKCAKDVEDYGRIDPETGEKVYGPYLAADAIFIQGDHVLLIERGSHPFKGCLALPGGFVDERENVVEAAIREGAKEETGMKVSEMVIRKAYLRTDWYAEPNRDPRGRVVSASSLFHFNPTPPAKMTQPDEIAKYLALPRVQGGDDARRAFWEPISEIKRSDMAFDHYTQITRALDHLPGMI